MARPADADLWWRVCTPVVAAAARLFFRLHYVGASNVPRHGPAIVAGNHVSALDGILYALAIREAAGRTTRFLVASELFASAALGPPLRLFRQIPVRRGKSDAGALDEAIRTVRTGSLAAILPEGRVNRHAFGPLQPGRSGAARVALAAVAPIVPAGIWGPQRRWPHGGPTWRLPWRPRVVVAFGEPVPPRGAAVSPEDVGQLTRRVMEGIDEQVALARSLA